MGDATAMDETVLLRHLIVGAMAIALKGPVYAVEQTFSYFVSAARIVVEEDDPPARRTGDPNPHPVFCGGRLVAVEDLQWCLIDADIAAATQLLIHQVDQRLDSLGERNDPGGLGGPRQLNPVPGEDRFLTVQRQRIDVFTGD